MLVSVIVVVGALVVLALRHRPGAVAGETWGDPPEPGAGDDLVDDDDDDLVDDDDAADVDDDDKEADGRDDTGGPDEPAPGRDETPGRDEPDAPGPEPEPDGVDRPA
jgi:hypothetical protein